MIYLTGALTVVQGLIFLWQQVIIRCLLLNMSGDVAFLTEGLSWFQFSIVRVKNS